MLGRLKAMLGLRPSPTPAPQATPSRPTAHFLNLNGQAPEIAAALNAEPGLVPLAAVELPLETSLEVLAALEGSGAVRVSFAKASLLSSSYVSRDKAAAIAAALSPAERELVVDGVRGLSPLTLRDAGFELPGPPPLPGRGAPPPKVLRRNDPLPPSLDDWRQRNQFDVRAAAVRQGAAGFAADERSQIRRVLCALSPADREAVRRALVLSPPHPALKKIRGDAALKGPATVDGLLRLLSGEPFGARPSASHELRQKAMKAVAVAAHGLDAAQQKALTRTLLGSDALVDLVARNGAAGLTIIDKLGADFAEKIHLDWSAKQIVTDLSQAAPERLSELRGEADRTSPDKVLEGLNTLDKASFGGTFSAAQLIADLGFSRAVDVAETIKADAHGRRSFQHLHGSEGFGKLVRTKRGDALAEALKEAGRAIVEFGSNGVAIYGGALRPKFDAPRTRSIERAEEVIAAAAGVDLEALRAGGLDLEDQSRVSRAMKSFIEERDPELAKMLSTELLGRRFIARRFYDELYAKGAKNPEHRYSVKTFESWARGAAFVREAALKSAGRPLAPGEFRETMQQAHALAAAGMVDVRESHIKLRDLGRLRTEKKDHVQLGGMMHEVDAKTAALLAKNPYLSPDQMVMPGKDSVRRSIIFARGPDVPAMIEDLDTWVRAHEGQMSAEALAAEVHHRLVSIHPFMDGNGRTAKLMTDFILKRSGFEPPLWRRGKVMKNVETWPQAVAEGVAFEQQIVQRYFRAAAEPDTRLEPPQAGVSS